MKTVSIILSVTLFLIVSIVLLKRKELHKYFLVRKLNKDCMSKPGDCVFTVEFLTKLTLEQLIDMDKNGVVLV